MGLCLCCTQLTCEGLKVLTEIFLRLLFSPRQLWLKYCIYITVYMWNLVYVCKHDGVQLFCKLTSRHDKEQFRRKLEPQGAVEFAFLKLRFVIQLSKSNSL